jgi:hypothetical protein
MKTTANFKRNKFFFFFGAMCVAASIALSLSIRANVWVVSLGRETAKTILSTIMGVSGSIIGFLVIYLSLALEGLKRHYGKQATAMFLKDRTIWVMCGFFCTILLLAIWSFLWADAPGRFFIWSFNFSCVFFAIGIAAIVPFGIEILNRTDTTTEITKWIDGIEQEDFRLPSTEYESMGPMYWTLSEDTANKVDRLSAILYHNISEDNSRVSASILVKFLSEISILVKIANGQHSERMLYRYLDIVANAFDYAKLNNNEVVIKTMLECLKSTSSLVAKWKMGPEAVERMFTVIRNMTQYFIEQNKEQLADEAFWAYYHMAKAQIAENLPPANQTWDIQENGEIMVLDNRTAGANEHRFDTLDKALTLDMSQLVDRSFYSQNRYINMKAVEMTGQFLTMLVQENVPEIPKALLGDSIAYQASKQIIRSISPVNPNNIRYLQVYAGASVLVSALKENSRFSQIVFDNYIEICNSVIEMQALIKWDLRDIGGLGRLIVASAGEITNVVQCMRSLLEINRMARAAIKKELGEEPDRRRRYELEAMMIMARKDITSWRTMQQRKAALNEELGNLIQLYMDNKGLNPD